MVAFGKFTVGGYLAATQSAIAASLDDPAFADSVTRAAQVCLAALQQGGKVLLAGNGGSAADAQHMAGEFVSRFYFDRPALPAVALTVDSSILTAIANDYGYDQVFSRQVEALGQPGDVFIGISTSGRSPNVLRGIAAARERGLKVIVLTGSGSSGGTMAELADVAICAASGETPQIQQVHIIAGHAICAAVEAAMFADRQPG